MLSLEHFSAEGAGPAQLCVSRLVHDASRDRFGHRPESDMSDGRLVLTVRAHAFTEDNWTSSARLHHLDEPRSGTLRRVLFPPL